MLGSFSEEQKAFIKDMSFVVVPFFFWILVAITLNEMAVLIFFNEDEVLKAAGLLLSSFAVLGIVPENEFEQRMFISMCFALLSVFFWWFLSALVSEDGSASLEQFFVASCYGYVCLVNVGNILKAKLNLMEAMKSDTAAVSDATDMVRKRFVLNMLRHGLSAIFANLPIALKVYDSYDIDHDLVYYDSFKKAIAVRHNFTEFHMSAIQDSAEDDGRAYVLPPFFFALGVVNTVFLGACCLQCYNYRAAVSDNYRVPAGRHQQLRQDSEASSPAAFHVEVEMHMPRPSQQAPGCRCQEALGLLRNCNTCGDPPLMADSGPDIEL